MEIAAAAGVLALVVGIGLYVLYQQQMGNPRGVARRFSAAPVSRIDAIDGAGPHRLSGTARALGAAPTSPVSGRPYLALDVLVQAHSDGTSRRTHRAAVDFLLDDGSGVVLVRAGGVEVPVQHDHDHPATSLDQAPFADEVLRAGGVSIGSPTTCRVRMFEGVLAPGTQVGVLGVAEPADDAARALGALWSVRAGPGAPLLVRAEPAAP